MSFLGNEPTPAPGGEPPFENDGWWPDVDLQALRTAVRLDSTVTTARLQHSLVTAILAVNQELAAWKLERQLGGFASLGEVPAPTVAGESALAQHYRRAIYCALRADLIERYRDFDTTGAGDKRAEALEGSIDSLRRDMRWAISDFLGRRRTTVELI